MKSTRKWLITAAGAMLLGSLWLLLSKQASRLDHHARHGLSGQIEATPSEEPVEDSDSPATVVQVPRAGAIAVSQQVTAASLKNGKPLVRATWGSGPGQLGRSRPAEANPEAATAFARDASGNIVVIDKVNGRLVRFGPNGDPLDTIPSPVAAPQELLSSPDGSLAVMDRLVDQSVALLDKNGKLIGKLPIVGTGIDKGGSATGLFRDKDGVYVESEHAQVVRIGDAAGSPDGTRPMFDGRPTRDGGALVSAHLVDPSTGSFAVRVIDRETGDLRVQRQLTLTVPLLSIVFLDSDPAGNIYAGVHVGQEMRPGEMLNEAIQVLCLGPSAELRGTATLVANTMPEESFRDLSVLDDGTILYMQRNETGVAITQHQCS
jgi:hypothetical protein